MSSNLFQMFQNLQSSPDNNAELTAAMAHVRTYADLLGKMMPKVKVEFSPAVPEDQQDPDGKFLDNRDFQIETVTFSVGEKRAQPIRLSMIADTGASKAEHGFYAGKDAWLGLYSWAPDMPGLTYYTSRRQAVGSLAEEGEEPLANLVQRIGIVHSGEFDKYGKLNIRLNGDSTQAHLSTKATEGWYRVTYSPFGAELQYASFAEQTKHTLMGFMAYGAPLEINVRSFTRGTGEKAWTYFKLQNLAQLFRKQMWMLEHGKITMDDILADRSSRIIDAQTDRKIVNDQKKSPEVLTEVKLGTQYKETFTIKVVDADNPQGKLVDISTLIDNGVKYDVMNGSRSPWVSGQMFTSEVKNRATGIPKSVTTLAFWAKSGDKWLVVSRKQ